MKLVDVPVFAIISNLESSFSMGAFSALMEYLICSYRDSSIHNFIVGNKITRKFNYFLRYEYVSVYFRFVLLTRLIINC